MIEQLETHSHRNLLTAAEVALRLGVTPKTLRNWRALGIGPAWIGSGKGVAYSLEAVMAWEAQQEDRARADRQAKLKHITVNVRPHPTKPNRLQADMLLPPPYKRARIAIPKGLDDVALAEQWARGQLKRIMAEQDAAMRETKEDNAKHDPNVMTLTKFWTTRYIPEKVSNLRPGTQADTETTWRLYIEHEFGDMPINEIDTSRILAFRNLLRGGNNKKASSRNKIVKKVVAALNYAEECGLLDKRPKVKDEKVEKVAKAVYSRSEIDSMLEAAKAISLEHEVFILLLCHGALRIGEVNALHWTDLDLGMGTLKIQRTEWMRQIQEAPKGQVGTLPLSASLRTTLGRWKKEGGDRGPLILPMYDDATHVWRCRHGAELLPAISRRAGIRASGPHLIRHTVLTHLAEAGVSPYALQAMARHTNLTTTMRYYIHLEQAKLAGQAINVLDAGDRPADPVTPAQKPDIRTAKLRVVSP